MLLSCHIYLVTSVIRITSALGGARKMQGEWDRGELTLL